MTKERIINVLKHLNLQTTHYRVPVEVVDDAQLDAAAEQILSLMQPNEVIEPQLQQTSCYTALAFLEQQLSKEQIAKAIATWNITVW